MKRALLISSVFALAFTPAGLAQKAELFTDDHQHVDAEVRTSGGESLGTVERVRFSSTDRARIDAYVIETGGILDIGGREILVSADNVEWTGEAEQEQVLQLDFTAAEAAAMPSFDESRATDWWLSDVPETARDEETRTAEREDEGGNFLTNVFRGNRDRNEDAEMAESAEARGAAETGADAQAEAGARNELAMSEERHDGRSEQARAQGQARGEARAERQGRSESARGEAGQDARAEAETRMAARSDRTDRDEGEDTGPAQEASVQAELATRGEVGQGDERSAEGQVRAEAGMAATTESDQEAWNENFRTAAWDIEDWTDSTVYLSEGDQLGVVTDVRTDADGVSALVVETDAAYDSLENEIEILIEDVVAVRDNGTDHDVQVASSAAYRRD